MRFASLIASKYQRALAPGHTALHMKQDGTKYVKSTWTWAWNRVWEAEMRSENWEGLPTMGHLYSYRRIASMLGAHLLYARFWSKHFYSQQF